MGTIKAIRTFFLRARHWQLFTLFMGLYMLGVVVLFAGELGAAPKPGGTSAAMIAGETFVFFLWMLSFLGWIGTMGLFLNTLKEPSVRSRTRFLWIALVYTPLYICLFFAYFFSSNAQKSAWVILPPHLLAMFCILYVVYFAAKGLAMVEKSGRVTFYDYAGPFFLIWFFPAGIWFVQPRVNRLYAQSREAQAGAKTAAN